MKKLFLTLAMSICMLGISFAQNGKYDLRTTLHHIDCDANKAYFDIAIKASDANSHFRLGYADIRLSFDRSVLATGSIFIEEELDISGPIISDDGLLSVYTHKLVHLDTTISYGLEFGGQGGYELTHNEWVSITRLGADIADVGACGGITFNPRLLFPGTDINENFQGNPFYDITKEGNYENAFFCIPDYCPSVNTCPNDITFTTQQQIDDFATDYPGCTEIPGDLYIQGTNSTAITNLDGLSQLTKIGGVLSIFNNNALTDLSGLHNITTVGDALAIGYNNGLPNLTELSSLTSVGGQFLLFSNTALTDIGINNLNTIGGNIQVKNNHALTNFNMNNLTFVDGNFSIENNGNLLDLEGLNNLTTIGGDLFIMGNGIISLALNKLNAINGQLLIKSNRLTTLDGLENLDYTTIQDLVISANYDLSFCSTKLICNYLENGGTSVIGNNGPGGCNDINQVQAGCDAEALCATQVLTDTRTLISDNDLFIDAVGFANNPSITLTDATTPAGAALTDISLECYFRLKGNSCEDEIAIKITDPEGTTQSITAYTTCNGGTGLYYVSIDMSDRVFSGNGTDWLIEFDDSNDQNAGDEYSVRFARLTYNTSLNTSGGTAFFFRDEITKISDMDIFIDAVGFDNNPYMTFTDPGIPANADLSYIQLELYFRLEGSSCENEIAIQITDPAGNTQPLTVYTACDGGTGLRYINLNIPSGFTTGTVGDWVVQFDDTNDQNTGDEYSVRFGRLSYRAEYYQCSEAAMVYENDDTIYPIEMQKNLNTSAQKNDNTTTPRYYNTLKLYPIPAIQHLNVDYTSEATSTVNFEIVSNNGSTVMSKAQATQAGLNTVRFDIAQLPAGHYYIRTYSAGDKPQMQPFIKIAP